MNGRDVKQNSYLQSLQLTIDCVIESETQNPESEIKNEPAISFFLVFYMEAP
jgi:hypothetical protein